jgi:hypothetical protein
MHFRLTSRADRPSARFTSEVAYARPIPAKKRDFEAGGHWASATESVKVFDDIPRSDMSPSRYSEPAFEYTNRSARLEAIKIREVIEAWFDEFPQADRPVLRTRLRSSANKEHFAAFFELYLFVLLSRLGYSLECHPSVRDTRRRPDFRASTSQRSHLYLEAVMAYHEGDHAQAATARENAVFDAINTMESPDFWLSLEVSGAPRTPPPAKRLKRDLTQWLSTLNWQSLRASYISKDYRSLPRLTFNCEGWTIVFSPIPKGEKARGSPGARPIGAKSGSFHISRAKDAVRDAIALKATEYGQLGHPYVITVNSYGVHTDREDALEALYGTAQVVIDPSARTPMVHYATDGAWRGPRGPRNTRVSGVLVIDSLHPWSVAARTPLLLVNPWAKYRLRGPITTLPCVRLLRGRLKDLSGLSARLLMDLPEQWPEDDATG